MAEPCKENKLTKKTNKITDKRASDIQSKFTKITNKLETIVFERDEVIEAIKLSMLSNQNVLLLGPPGTGKSMTVKLWASFISGGTYFEKLLSKFSTPDELFGPISVKGLEEDRLRHQTKNYLPEADFAFIDEVFKANTGVLNAMLKIMNEREYDDDGMIKKVPLLAMVGASNEIPEPEDGLDAMYDRFHIKLKVPYIFETSNWVRMIGSTGKAVIPEDQKLKMEDIAEAAAFAQNQITVDEEMLEILLTIKNQLKREALIISDRTWWNTVQSLKSQAYLSGRTSVQIEDFEFLIHMLWNDDRNIVKVRSTVLEIANPDKNEAMMHLDTARDVYEKAISDEETDKGNIGDALAAIEKIKKCKVKVDKKVTTRKNHKRDTADLKKISNEMGKMIGSLSSESLGLGEEYKKIFQR